ncbi:MAG: hypothetical protein JNK72_23175 [Myxococcales bacterium]|nr:hypothetical protein [Myxococcales bacterium]
MSAPRPRRRRLTLGALVAALSGTFLWPGGAVATVEEQRARLPPPATCQDPLEGVWMSHKYETPFDEWMIFTVAMRRDPRGASAPLAAGHPGRIALTGQIEAHAWFGAGPQGSEPPPCTPGIQHWTVMMTGEGYAEGNHIEFWGTRWAISNVFCGPRHFRYNLDHFSGTMNTEIHEFQSVNNDGGRAINDPTVFRRVRCFEPPSPPHPVVAPPTFQPPRRARCSWLS